MAAAINLTIHLRDGSSQTISQPVSSGHENVRYDQLIKSISNVQEQANSILTILVNKEKAQKNSTDNCGVDDSNGSPGANSNDELETNNNGNETDGTDDDDDEEDDDDDDSKDKPPEKKRKT